MASLDYAGEEQYEQTTVPPFGHHLLKFFPFADGYVNLNHGAFGSLPLPVSAVANRLARECDANPDRFLRFTYQPLLDDARARIAQLVGAKNDEVVLVPNASHGLNTVLWNIPWRAGDIIVGATTTYADLDGTLRYLHDTHPGTVLAPMELVFPATHSDIRASFRAHLRRLKGSLPPGWSQSADMSSETPKIVAVMDSIVATPGVYMPWRDMVKIAREEGVWSVVDAAHSIGQEVDISLSAIQPDFWVSNCHKWLYAKRGCAVLYVPLRNQRIIRSSFPTNRTYEDSGTSFVKQHDFTGTLDFTPNLTIAPALKFRQWLGGEHAINAYCHQLALDGGRLLAQLMGTRLLDDTPNSELTLNMVNVELPIKSDKLDVVSIYRRLLDEYNTFAAVYRHNGRWWVRCSTQVWNEIGDFEYLGNTFNKIAKELQES